MQRNRLIRTAITLAVIGIVLLVLGLLFPTIGDFLTYIYIAVVAAMLLFVVLAFLPRRAIGILTRAAIIGIMVGIAGMIQPFFPWGFRYGFYLLLASTVIYTVSGYVSSPSGAAPSPEGLEEMPVSLSAAESMVHNPGQNSGGSI